MSNERAIEILQATLREIEKPNPPSDFDSVASEYAYKLGCAKAAMQIALRELGAPDEQING